MCCEMGFMHLEAAIWNSKASATFDPPSRRQFYSSSFTNSPLSSRRATSSINPLSLLSTFDTPNLTVKLSLLTVKMSLFYIFANKQNSFKSIA